MQMNEISQAQRVQSLVPKPMKGMVSGTRSLKCSCIANAILRGMGIDLLWELVTVVAEACPCQILKVALPRRLAFRSQPTCRAQEVVVCTSNRLRRRNKTALESYSLHELFWRG